MLLSVASIITNLSRFKTKRISRLETGLGQVARLGWLCYMGDKTGSMFIFWSQVMDETSLKAATAFGYCCSPACFDKQLEEMICKAAHSCMAH
jgi:hypothetical protein